MHGLQGVSGQVKQTHARRKKEEEEEEEEAERLAAAAGDLSHGEGG